MGIDISAKVIYGVTKKLIDDEEIWEELVGYAEEGSLDYASPTYDSPSYRWIIGIEVDPNDISDNFLMTLSEVDIVELLGFELYEKIQSLFSFHCTPHVY